MSNVNDCASDGSSPISIKTYSEKAFVVRGDTKLFKEKLMKLGGKWNPNLRDGPGWIFSNRHKQAVVDYLTKFAERVETKEVEEVEEEETPSQLSGGLYVWKNKREEELKRLREQKLVTEQLNRLSEQVEQLATTINEQKARTNSSLCDILSTVTLVITTTVLIAYHFSDNFRSAFYL